MLTDNQPDVLSKKEHSLSKPAGAQSLLCPGTKS